MAYLVEVAVTAMQIPFFHHHHFVVRHVTAVKGSNSIQSNLRIHGNDAMLLFRNTINNLVF
jgi:hypothetical protein